LTGWSARRAGPASRHPHGMWPRRHQSRSLLWNKANFGLGALRSCSACQRKFSVCCWRLLRVQPELRGPSLMRIQSTLLPAAPRQAPLSRLSRCGLLGRGSANGMAHLGFCVGWRHSSCRAWGMIPGVSIKVCLTSTLFACTAHQPPRFATWGGFICQEQLVCCSCHGLFDPVWRGAKLAPSSPDWQPDIFHTLSKLPNRWSTHWLILRKCRGALSSCITNSSRVGAAFYWPAVCSCKARFTLLARTCQSPACPNAHV
jgi:hypothetical protein